MPPDQRIAAVMRRRGFRAPDGPLGVALADVAGFVEWLDDCLRGTSLQLLAIDEAEKVMRGAIVTAQEVDALLEEA